MPSLSQEIASAAAALVVDEGLEYGPAKRRAVKQLGLPERTALPDNEALEAAVREHIAIFCADSQPAELAALRTLALLWMQRLVEFRPHLTGAVWNGTATRLSSITIQLFCDDSKSAEITLIENQVGYEPRTVTGFTRKKVEMLSFCSICTPLQENVEIHLVIYDYADLRSQARAGNEPRAARGSTVALQQLLCEVL